MIRPNILTDATAAQRFIDGVKALKDPAAHPWQDQPGLAMYDFFVYWHSRAMMTPTPNRPGVMRNAAHVGPAFLPWHRYFLLRLEDSLRQALGDDDFRLPYWNWPADAELPNPATSHLWSNNLLGQFVGPSWHVRLVENPATGGLMIVDLALQRDLGGDGGLANRPDIRNLLASNPAYDSTPYDQGSNSFRNFLEGWINVPGRPRMHNDVHLWVGGDMSASSSPNDPVFFLHHANIDRVWAAWQQKYPVAPYVPPDSASADLLFHRLDDRLYTFFDETVTPNDMLDVSVTYNYDSLDDILH